MADEILGTLGAIHMFSGAPVSVSSEVLIDSGDHRRYLVADQETSYWAIDGYGLNIYVDDVIVTTGFEVEYAGGNVIFAVSQGASVIKADYTYYPVAEVGGFFNYKLSIVKEEKDTTCFIEDTETDFGWSTCKTGLGSWSVSAEKYYLNENMFSLLTAETKFVLVMYIDTVSKIRYEGYVHAFKLDINNNLKDIISESLEFKGYGKIYFRD